MSQQVTKTIVQREGDPYIYLYVMGEWYCYNPEDEPLGSGAMGTVYLGYRVKTKGRIAVKRVKDCFANNKMIRDRAKQEASLAFRHPNLVEMIGYCEYAPGSGPIFILSNFVQGVNIDKYVKDAFTNMPDRVEKICHLIYPVLDALDYVHSRGVIHRDIKPSNIMVENDSNVRLMDLGIARMSNGNKFSAYGFIGTPEYSAPEQISRAKDSPVQIDASTDIYELGITFYELLTGKNPMECETEAETLTKQMKTPLPGSPQIPTRLMSVLLKATEKEQSKRYQTAGDFKAAIEQSLFIPPTTGEKVRSMIENHAQVAILSLVALIVIILCLILFI